MARNYEALVQVGFRTKKEVKEKISKLANKAGKGTSEYLANIIEYIFNLDEPIETLQETLKNSREILKNNSELDSKLRELFLELSLSYPLNSTTPIEMAEQLLYLAKNKKIKRVRD
jgi:predicted DNA-binding protein